MFLKTRWQMYRLVDREIIELLGVMANEQVYGLVVREFKLQWHHYVPFSTNIHGKGMISLIHVSRGKTSTRKSLAINNLQRYICI